MFREFLVIAPLTKKKKKASLVIIKREHSEKHPAFLKRKKKIIHLIFSEISMALARCFPILNACKNGSNNKKLTS